MADALDALVAFFQTILGNPVYLLVFLGLLVLIPVLWVWARIRRARKRQSWESTAFGASVTPHGKR